MILRECQREGITGGCYDIETIRNWAVYQLQIDTRPSYRTGKRFLNDKSEIINRLTSTQYYRRKFLTVTSDVIENIVRD